MHFYKLGKVYKLHLYLSLAIDLETVMCSADNK